MNSNPSLIHQNSSSLDVPSTSSTFYFDDGKDDSLSIHSSDSNYLMELSDASEHDETILPKTNYHSPYYVNVPTPKHSPLTVASDANSELTSDFVREYPTDILVDRFAKWRKILKGLIVYLREVSFAQEQFARINYQLKNAVKFPFLTDLEEGNNKVVDPLQKPKKNSSASAVNKVKTLEDDMFHNSSGSSSIDVNLQNYDPASASSGFMKFGSGSVQDIQVVLKKYHLSLSNQQFKTSKELVSAVIPKLEELRKDLQVKIKEIKELHGDFKTNINEHVALTGQLLHRYIAAVKFLTTQSTESDIIKLKNNQNLKPKHDPYLLKLQLDLQLKRQLLEENYLQEAYINLQSSGMELEKIVYSEIQRTLQRYSALIDSGLRLSIKNLCTELQQGMLSKPPAVEWDHFVGYHPKCLINWKSTEPVPLPRKLSDIRYPRMKSSLAKCIKAGYLLKKSKYLKNYNKGYFVLTSNYLHEFKSSNFFKITQNTGESKEHSEIPAGGHKKSSMIPVMSISLNDSILMESTDTKFVLRGSSTFNEPEKKHPVPDTTKIIQKSTSSFHKLLKGGSKSQQQLKNSQQQQQQQQQQEQRQQDPASRESTKTNNWVFKTVSQSATPEDIRDFKKWVTELKNLTSFKNSVDRAKFIEDKILRAHNRVASNVNLNKLKSTASSASSLVGTPGGSTPTKHGIKPHFIQINQPPMLNPNMRSKVNTPAIDDNGNLIMALDRRPPSVISMPAVLSPQTQPQQASPSQSVRSGSGSSSSSIQLQQQGYVITSNGVSPILETAHTHQRNPSIPTSIHNSSHSSPSILVPSSSSPLSNSSGGGYFALPIRNTSQGSTPGISDYIQPLAATASGNTPAITNSQSQLSLPKFRVNDQEWEHHRQPQDATSSPPTKSPPVVSRTPEVPGSRALPYQYLKKNISTGSVPTMSSDATNHVFLTPKHNNSSQSLTQAKTQPIRRHRKNVSFSSLNSLMFSKKGANVSNNNMTDYFMSDNRIQEQEDPETIDLNKSLYS